MIFKTKSKRKKLLLSKIKDTHSAIPVRTSNIQIASDRYYTYGELDNLTLKQMANLIKDGHQSLLKKELKYKKLETPVELAIFKIRKDYGSIGNLERHIFNFLKLGMDPIDKLREEYPGIEWFYRPLDFVPTKKGVDYSLYIAKQVNGTSIRQFQKINKALF